MKIPGLSGYLGLALGERSILAAEITVSGEKAVLRRAAEFAVPLGMSWERADAIGEALQQFLRHNRFSASRTVVGVPARWIMAREREVPPAPPEIAINSLRLQAERLFPPELKELVFDFAGETDAKESRRVLLVAIPRHRLDQINTFADSAGLSLLAVTSSTLALASSQGNGSNDLVLAVAPEAAEFAGMHQGTPNMLRHMAVTIPTGGGGGGSAERGGTDPAMQLGTELRRVVSVMPTNGHARELLLWDSVGMNAGDTDAIAGRVGMAVRRGDARTSMGVGEEAGVAHAERFSPAVALALAGTTGKKRRAVPIDFLKAKLAAPRKKRLGRRAAWGGFAAVGLLTALGILVVDIQKQQKTLDDLNGRRTELAPNVKAANAIIDRIDLTSGWYHARPKLLECLRDVTLAFRDEEPIWLTNVHVQENSVTARENGKQVRRERWKCTLTGKASSQEMVHSVRRRLSENTSLADVTLTRWSAAQGPGASAARSAREGGSSSREAEGTFIMSFTFTSLK